MCFTGQNSALVELLAIEAQTSFDPIRSGFNWMHLDAFGFIWIHSNPFESIRMHLDSSAWKANGLERFSLALFLTRPSAQNMPKNRKIGQFIGLNESEILSLSKSLNLFAFAFASASALLDLGPKSRSLASFAAFCANAQMCCQPSGQNGFKP